MSGKQVLIGTSGWSYPHWSGTYYPDSLPESDYLEHYSAEFQTVEINNTFYQLPEAETLKTWRQSVPDNFTFAVKANRYITHMKKLKDPAEPVENFMESIAELGEKLGPLLFQLPPNWRSDPERLEHFLDIVPEENRCAFEFRDSSWFEPAVFDLLREHNAAFCIYQLEDTRTPNELTADFIYIRLHGPNEAYSGSYTKKQLAGWAGAISSWQRAGKDIFCYFNNDMEGYAPQNAATLKSMLGD